MAVASKKSFDYTSKYPIMTEARQVFPIGQEFWYSPLVDPSVEILVCAKDMSGLNTLINKEICDKHCCINKWCAEIGNFDSVGNNFIPECSNREDGIDVYFELCQ